MNIEIVIQIFDLQINNSPIDYIIRFITENILKIQNMKTFTLFLQIVLLVSIPFTKIIAQDYSFKKRNFDVFDKSSKEKIIKAGNKISKADKTSTLAEGLLKTGKVKRAKNKFSKAAKIYTKNFKKVYFIYLNEFKKNIETADSVKKYKLLALKRQLVGNLSKSITLRKNAHLTRNNSEACKIYKTAHKQEVLAFELWDEIFDIYYDRISFKPAKKDSTYLVETRKKEDKEVLAFEQQYFSIDDEKNYIIPDDAIADNSNSSNNSTNGSNSNGKTRDGNVNNNPKDTKNTNDGNNSDSDDNNGKTNDNNNHEETSNHNYSDVVYKVQIVAARKQVSKRELNFIYKGNEKVIKERSGGFYRYLFGNFTSFEVAKKAQNNSGVADAFIVAYKNGKRFKTYDSTNINLTRNGITYRIQIGTSRIPASRNQKNKMNKTNLKVQTFKSLNIYKYTIGDFSTYNEALNLKKSKGLRKCFIVKYRNGKEVY